MKGVYKGLGAAVRRAARSGGCSYGSTRGRGAHQVRPAGALPPRVPARAPTRACQLHEQVHHLHRQISVLVPQQPQQRRQRGAVYQGGVELGGARHLRRGAARGGCARGWGWVAIRAGPATAQLRGARHLRRAAIRWQVPTSPKVHLVAQRLSSATPPPKTHTSTPPSGHHHDVITTRTCPTSRTMDSRSTSFSRNFMGSAAYFMRSSRFSRAWPRV